MAPKRPPPAEDPPAPSSTSEEEEENEENEENEEEEEEEEESSPEESSEEEEEGEENKSTVLTPPPAVDKKASSNKLVATTPAKSTPQSSSEDEEDGSESESESDSPPKSRRSSRGADPTIKPIATKPMEETPKSKKARSKPGVFVTPSPVKSSPVKPSNSKRPGEIGLERKESKRAKKKEPEAEAEEEEDGKKTGDDSKKQMFQRIWSEEDELGILKGMIDYSAKNGSVPYPNGDMNEFYDFVKNTLHGDFSRVQLTDKARRLKKKYSNNVSRAKLGEDPTFQKPHEQRAFELSKKIWGGEGNSVGVQQSNKANGKARKNQKPNKAVKVEDVEVLSVINGDDKEAVKLENEPKSEPPKKYSLVVSDFTRINESVGMSSSMDRAIEIGLGLLSEPVKAELKEKWKELEDEEFQLYMKKLDLIQMEARVSMQAYRAKHQ